MDIGFLVFPRLTQLDLTAPFEVLARIPQAKIHLLWRDKRPVVAEYGLALQPTMTFRECPDLDVLVVPGGAGTAATIQDAEVLSFLRNVQARYYTSVCTGALLLGAAGHLRGFRATTHWLSMDLLPLVGAEPVRERVVVDRNRVTSAGVTAGLDLGFQVASLLMDRDFCLNLQLLLEHDPTTVDPEGTPGGASPERIEGMRQARSALQATRRAALEQALNLTH